MKKLQSSSENIKKELVTMGQGKNKSLPKYDWYRFKPTWTEEEAAGGELTIMQQMTQLEKRRLELQKQLAETDDEYSRFGQAAADMLRPWGMWKV